MFSTANQWSSSILTKSIVIIFALLNISGRCRVNNEAEKGSLRAVLKNPQNKRLLRIVYFRETEGILEENRLRADVKNLTDVYKIDWQLHILNQSTPFVVDKLCSVINAEQRDTVFIADLYTKEIDLISRALQIPTIATTNRYSIVQGKLHNPYLFKYMPAPIDKALSMIYALDTRSVYTRIALISDNSLDMTEYRLLYTRSAKQDIIYRAYLPRVSVGNSDVQNFTRRILSDLIEIKIDVILCIMSTERESQFMRTIIQLSTDAEADLLLNQTKWWFASRLDEKRDNTYYPKVYSANEDRRRLFSHFSSSIMKILVNAIMRTYSRLPISSSIMGPTKCATPQSVHQLRKTDTFIQLFTNFTEWNCDIRIGLGIDPILFEPKSLTWRLPTVFTVHTEHACQGILTRIFYSTSNNADQLFRSCRSANTSTRRTSASNQQDNSSSTPSSNSISDIKNYYQMIGKLTSDGLHPCQFVQMQAPLETLIVVGVVEPPYIFVSDIDPLLINFTTDSLFFRTKMIKPPHCCYGISVNLLLRIEDSKLAMPLNTMKLFVFADKPNKWLSLTESLQNHRAHLSISAIPYESFLARSIDLSPPFYHSSYVILTVPASIGPSLGAFLQPFSWTTWCMIFLLLSITAVFETFFEWHSPYGLTPRGRRREKVFSFASALTLSWSVIFSHTFKTKSPKCWSNRFLGNVWGGFGIVFIAIYTAKLAAFMVEVGREHTANSIHEIVEMCRKLPRCTVGVIANTSDEEYLKRFYRTTLYRHIHHVSSYGHGIDLLRAYKINYLLMDHSMARYYLTRDVYKLIRISDESFGQFGLSLGFSKFVTDLKENITNILLSYVDKGIIQRLHDDWYVYENCEIKLMEQNRELSVDRFVGVFILLLAGMVVGVLVLMLEWLIFKYAVPYWRKRQWSGWLFGSQRLYAVLNVSNNTFNEAYQLSRDRSCHYVGQRLHDYDNRRDSLDLHMFNVPKLLSTSCRLQEQMREITREHQVGVNGDIGVRKDQYDDKQWIRNRIHELESELDRLKSQQRTHFSSKNSSNRC